MKLKHILIDILFIDFIKGCVGNNGVTLLFRYCPFCVV